MSGIENLLQSTTTTSSKLSRPTKSKSTMAGERRTLQTIQPSIKDGLTRHVNRDSKLKGKIIASKKPLQIYEDPEPISKQFSPSASLTSTPTRTSTDSSSSPLASSTPEITVENGECSCTCHSNSEEENMIDFITSEPSEGEWKELAEERSQALDESLAENRQLHFEAGEYRNQISNLNDSVRELEEEKRRLGEQRDYFANILQKLVDNNDDDDSQFADSALSDTDESQSDSST